jgi:hypothetical protein
VYNAVTQSGYSSVQCCDILETTARTVLLRSLGMIFLYQPKGNLKMIDSFKDADTDLERNAIIVLLSTRSTTPLNAKPSSIIPSVFCVQAIYNIDK